MKTISKYKNRYTMHTKLWNDIVTYISTNGVLLSNSFFSTRQTQIKIKLN
jgi:hypothetical protein